MKINFVYVTLLTCVLWERVLYYYYDYKHFLEVVISLDNENRIIFIYLIDMTVVLLTIAGTKYENAYHGLLIDVLIKLIGIVTHGSEFMKKNFGKSYELRLFISLLAVGVEMWEDFIKIRAHFSKHDVEYITCSPVRSLKRRSSHTIIRRSNF